MKRAESEPGNKERVPSSAKTTYKKLPKDKKFYTHRRKLLALALASLLTTESPVVLSRIYNIFLNIAETLNDITRPDENGGAVDSLMAGVSDSVLDTDDIDYETEHDSRLVLALQIRTCLLVQIYLRNV